MEDIKSQIDFSFAARFRVSSSELVSSANLATHNKTKSSITKSSVSAEATPATISFTDSLSSAFLLDFSDTEKDFLDVAGNELSLYS